MTEEGYRDMVIDHDKHLDSLTQSVSTLADNVLTTNNKLDNVIDVIQTQNVLTERLSNLDLTFRDSFGRVHTKIEDLENDVNTFIPGSVMKWITIVILGYTVTFGTFVTMELHRLDTFTSSNAVLQTEIQHTRELQFKRINDKIKNLTNRHING